MFNFQNPAGFLFILLIPLFFLLRKFKVLNQTVIYAVLGDWEGKSFTWNGRFRKFLSILTKLFMGAGFIFTLIAFCDPVISTQEKVYTTLGTDIVFVVDTSPSMAAKDIDGQRRIDAAKNAILSLTKNHDGYRFGLVGFGSNAMVMVPPTGDSSVFTKKLEAIQVGILGNGSAIGDGLSTAVCHLAASSAPKKCIILLTDGENNAGEIHPQTAAELAGNNDITLFIIGIGSRGTVPIEYTDVETGKLYSGYLESDFNASSLKQIASTGKGRYYEVRSVEELAASLASVAKAEIVNQNFTYKTITTPYYQQFLFLALIFFFLAEIFKRFILHEIIPFRYKKALLFRAIFLALSYFMVLLAWLGISWGTYLAPVQKNDTAVSFVFDISNSMLAKDGPENMTRLNAAKIYAEKLISRMNGTGISVVLAKGDGVTAIPVTEDKAMIESLLEVMSPALMTVPGTSLGKGILCAKDSFPANYAAAGRIWVFTDGEETDGNLTSALSECLKLGIPVSIIGFGNEKETSILTGDGKTEVMSALRTREILQSIEEAKSKLNKYKSRTEVNFINSTEPGSAIVLLSQLVAGSEGKQITSYEVKPVPRYKFFLLLAFLLLAASFFAAEFDFSSFKKNVEAEQNQKSKNKAGLFGAFIIFSVFFGSCSSPSGKILKGTYEWHQKNYRSAVSSYLDAVENMPENKKQYLNYSLYDLGAAYSMLGEDDAALDRYSSISEDAPEKVRFNAYYNAGIIAHKNGKFDLAQEYFRKALEIDNTRIDAKINMELSIQMGEAESRQNENEVLPAEQEEKQNPDLEDKVFQHIKENDKKQWKNSETNQTQNLAYDY